MDAEFDAPKFPSARQIYARKFRRYKIGIMQLMSLITESLGTYFRENHFSKDIY